MKELLSKIQYKNFEAGEFIGAEKRSFEKTIELIEQFPWEAQREKIIIDLTNPSITIEGENGDFLKLALFFNNRFVLHYFSRDQVLFTKSFPDVKSTYPYLRQFFLADFEPADFKKENTWMQHNLKHFASREFKYFLTPSSIRKYLLNTTWISFAFTIFIVSFIILNPKTHVNGPLIFVITLSLITVGGGMNLLLFYNYYRHVKNKILILSKGNDQFYYGDKNAPVLYNKKDIEHFVRIEVGRRASTSLFILTLVKFRNGDIIRIPNLLIDNYALCDKLFEYPLIQKRGFPLIGRKAG